MVAVYLIDNFTWHNLPPSSCSSIETVINMRAFSVTTVSPGHRSVGLSHPLSVGVSEECKPNICFLYQEKHMNDRNNDPKCDAEEATMQSGQWLLYHNREPFTSPAPPPHVNFTPKLAMEGTYSRVIWIIPGFGWVKSSMGHQWCWPGWGWRWGWGWAQVSDIQGKCFGPLSFEA